MTVKRKVSSAIAAVFIIGCVGADDSRAQTKTTIRTITTVTAAPMDKSLIVTAVTGRVKSIIRTVASFKTACLIELESASPHSIDRWRLFLYDRVSDNAAVTFCEARMIGDCIVSYGTDTRMVEAGDCSVEAQDITGFFLEDDITCDALDGGGWVGAGQ